MTPKISVIMPMYNVEKYVELAISSLLEQTFKDFELILIDDASTDRTLAIAKSFNDPRIQIIVNENNLGVGVEDPVPCAISAWIRRVVITFILWTATM